jgi:hypothetical protein
MAERVEWLHTERIAQLTGSRDPEDWPLPNVTDGWTVEGTDLGANAEHGDGRLYFFFGDVATTDNGEHRWAGWRFFLPNDHQGATDSTGQPDWRFCDRCHSLFRAPDGSTSDSACPAGGEHAAAGWNFVLPNDQQGGHAGIGQADWRFCRKCHSLGWGPNGGAAGSVCPGGNPRNSDLVAWTGDTALAAAIGMEDHGTCGATLPAGGLEGIGDQLGSQVISGRPADHAPRRDVDDGGQRRATARIAASLSVMRSPPRTLDPRGRSASVPSGPAARAAERPGVAPGLLQSTAVGSRDHHNRMNGR